MRRALAIATASLLCVNVAWLVYVDFFHGRGRFADPLIWVTILLSSFGAATFSRDHKFLAGLLVALVATVLGVLSNVARELYGRPGDLRGLSGALTAFALYLVGSSILSVIGTCAALALDRFRKDGAP